MSQSRLFSPLQLAGVTFPNRIFVSPMCQYSSEDGFSNDWHLVHLGSRAVGGAALVLTEASAVLAEGRISPQDLGLWKDDHIAGLRRIVQFLHGQGARAGVQLAHAGRKASMTRPWAGEERYLPPREGGWRDVMAPSAVPFAENYGQPIELDRAGSKRSPGRLPRPPAVLLRRASTWSNCTARTAICCTNFSRR